MKGIIVALSFLLLHSVCYSQAKTCTANCAPTNVLLFDFDVKAPEEATNPELFKRLYYIAPQLRRDIQRTASCLTYLDANETNQPGDIFPDGAATPNVYAAGPGEYSIGEYLLTGSISGEGNVFLVTANIETSISRKKIKTVTIPFSFAEGDTYTGIANKISMALGPLPEVIKNYETRERETNSKVALGQPLMKGDGEDLLRVKPKKTKLSMGEETEVEILLKDCDGYPLKNRVVSFTGEMYDSAWIRGTYGGTVTPSKVTTDAEGKAKVKFKTASKYKFAAIVAHYNFEQPCGRKDVITGSAAIDIQLKPYKVMVRYSKRIQVNTHRRNETSEYTEKSEGMQNYRAQYHAEFYYAPGQPMEGLSIASTDDTTGCSIYMADEKGISSDISFLHYIRRSADGTLISDDQNSHNLQGRLAEEEKAMAYLDTSGIHPFAFALNLKVTGVSDGKPAEPDILPVANIAASSLNKEGEVIYYSHPMNFPDLPYQRDCTFIYQFNSSQEDHGVLTKSEEFLKIKILIEK